jgi:hypothetical protein
VINDAEVTHLPINLVDPSPNYSPRNPEFTKFNLRGNEVSQPSFLVTFACKTNNQEKAIRGLLTISC